MRATITSLTPRASSVRNQGLYRDDRFSQVDRARPGAFEMFPYSQSRRGLCDSACMHDCLRARSYGNDPGYETQSAEEACYHIIANNSAARTSDAYIQCLNQYSNACWKACNCSYQADLIANECDQNCEQARDGKRLLDLQAYGPISDPRRYPNYEAATASARRDAELAREGCACFSDDRFSYQYV